MNLKITFVVLFLLVGSASLAQFSPVRRALDNMQEGDMGKAWELLERSLERDSLDLETYYVLSQFYDRKDNPRNSADSSYFFILKAREIYLALDEKELERQVKNGVDSLLLEKQKVYLDSQAFVLAKKDNTIDAYQLFRKKYPTSAQIRESIEREYEVAFNNARDIDNFQAYDDFMANYAQAPQFSEALERYELLLYKSYDERGTLQDYLDFLEYRPASPYRVKAEERILLLSTAGNRISDYQDFMSLCKSPALRKKVSGMVYHILRDKGSLENMPRDWWTDSLRSLSTQALELYPMFDESGFSLLTENGGIWAKDHFRSLPAEYICGPARGELFLTFGEKDSRLRDRNGRTIVNGYFSAFKDLGYGILSLERDGKQAIYLKNGSQVTAFLYEDVLPVGGEFIAVSLNGKWGLITFLGKTVLPPEFDRVEYLHGSILIQRDNKIAVTNNNALYRASLGDRPNLVFIYDEYESWPGDRIWVRSGNSEGLINNASAYDIELREQEIIPYDFGYVVRGEENLVLDTAFSTLLRDWSFLRPSKRFFHIVKNEQDYLMELGGGNILPYDTVSLWGEDFALVVTGENQSLRFKGEKRIRLEDEAQISLISDNGYQYLQVNDEAGLSVYDGSGVLVLQGSYDEVKVLGPEYLVTTIRGKKALFSNNGESLLPGEYDAFGTYEDGGISVLKEGKLGYFHLRDSISVDPKYSKRVIDTRTGVLAVSVEGGYHLVDRRGEPISDEIFTEIHAWNDTSFVIGKEDGYVIYDPVRDKDLVSDLIEFRWDSGPDNYVQVKGRNGFGLFHRNDGVIVPPSYTFIERMGSVFRAEKYLNEPDYYVVAYYSSHGELVYRKGLLPEQYERLMCDD